MSKSTKCFVLGGVAASLLCGVAFAEPKAPVVWQPPAEIAGKPAAPAAAAPAGAAATTAATATAPDPKAAKEQACAAEAKAKGLKKGKKWAFIDECMKK